MKLLKPFLVQNTIKVKIVIYILLLLAFIGCKEKEAFKVSVANFYLDYHALAFSHRENMENYPPENVGIDIIFNNESEEKIIRKLHSRETNGCRIRLVTNIDTIMTFAIQDEVVIPPNTIESIMYMVPFNQYLKLREIIKGVGNDNYELIFNAKVLFDCSNDQIQELNTNEMRTFLQFSDSSFMVLSTGEVLSDNPH